jgi:hypothetical protein
MLDVPAGFPDPDRGLNPMHRLKAGGNYRMVMQWKLAHGDTAGVREDFRKLREVQRALRPGDVAFDGTYHEAWLLLAIGDTAEATNLLDLSLDALPALGTGLTDQLPEAATLVRGMALRAALAAQAGDMATARRWAQDVLLLWSGADRELRPAVTKLRRLVPVQVK